MGLSVGLFLNAGDFPGLSHAQIYDLMLAEAQMAEARGFDELWITEHHFTSFGINSSALTAAAFLLGQTRTLNVGTAVTLAPQYHPVQLAEQAAILDQLSGGRFQLGLGRGGYRIDFDVFGTSVERWEQDVHATAEVLLNVWQNEQASCSSPYATFEHLQVNPRPRTWPHPPLLIASGGGESLNLAARNGLPLQFYFAAPTAPRISTLQRYYAAATEAGRDPSILDAQHLHALIVYVTDDAANVEAARAEFLAGMTHSFNAGDHPTVAPERSHRDAQGNPLDRGQLAQMALDAAFIGPAEAVTEQLIAFIEQTGAGRLALFHELVQAPEKVLASVERFGERVLPALRARFADGVPSPMFPKPEPAAEITAAAEAVAATPVAVAS